MNIEATTVAFVSPRFGDGVIGGAEAVLAEAAIGLAERGHAVEILTTCARDHFTWANEFPAGTSEHSGVTIRRFETELDTKGRHRDRIGDRILSGQAVDLQDQQRWVNDSLRCSGLWDHVFNEGDRYRALIFAPYMFWPTYAVGQIHPDRSIVMPCLHDEPPAYLEIFKTMMASFAGVWFLTEPERDLGHRLYDLPEQQTIVGASVTLPTSYNPDEFRQQAGIEGPYVYYGGRREWGKGWVDLMNGYTKYLEQRGARSALTLVTSGVGAVEPPPAAAARVIDVGLLSEADRDSAMAGAAAYLQPSAMESFSRTVLESMAAGTPVVANRASDVVAWHLANSGAGLTYGNEAELIECLNFVTDEPEAAAALAIDGRKYVTTRYALSEVLDRMEASLDAWLPSTAAQELTV